MRFADVLDRPAPGREELANPAHRALAREAAAKSVVLLRNEPVDGTPLLPLALASDASIALLGRLAGAVNLGDGGSSDVWAPQVVTPADGIRSALPDATVIENDGSDLQAAATLAATADVAVIVVGYTRLDEGEFIIVPRGTEHRPVAEEEVHVLLFEPATTLNTGNVVSDRTVHELERLG